MKSFIRKLSPSESLGLGGYSFETLKAGAILKVKRPFGITYSGKIRGWAGAAIRLWSEEYILVTEVSRIGAKKNIKGVIFRHSLSDAKKARIDFVDENEKPNFVPPRCIFYISEISEQRFDYRMSILIA